MIRITRTASAGVFIETDDVSILLDGVCRDFPPYLGTPDSIREYLTANPPDALLYTHYHGDHFDNEYALEYKKVTLRSHYGPEFAISGKIGRCKINAVETRHIGKTNTAHVSYVLTCDKTIWFMGDASPSELDKLSAYPKPDILIVPYAYVITESAWAKSKSTGASEIILLHMPSENNDPHDLWKTMRNIVKRDEIIIPDIELFGTK